MDISSDKVSLCSKATTDLSSRITQMTGNFTTNLKRNFKKNVEQLLMITLIVFLIAEIDK